MQLACREAAPVLIGGALEVGRDAPMMEQSISGIDSDYGLIVADVDSDKHLEFIARFRFLIGARRLARRRRNEVRS